MTNTFLQIPLETAIKASAAMLVAASKDEMTRTIMGAKFTGTHLVATDRYRVAHMEMPEDEQDESKPQTRKGEEFLIPRAALEWVTKITPKSLRWKNYPATALYTVRFEEDGDTLTASVIDLSGRVERSQVFDGLTGNYPPVERLVVTVLEGRDAEIQAAPVNLNAALLTGILQFVHKYGDNDANGSSCAKFTLTKTENPHKQGPVLIEGAGVSFLLQPNLLVR